MTLPSNVPTDVPTAKTILVADDSEAHLALISSMLKDRYTLVPKEDGKAALSYLKTNRPDLIILDVNMPFIDGLSIVERVKWVPRLQDVPTVVVTAHDDEETRENADWVKPDAFLLKSELNKALLVATVTRLLGA